MSVSALGNAIRSRIIVELLNLGEYSGIWLFIRANILESGYSPGRIFESGYSPWQILESGYSPGRIYWNLIIRRNIKK